MRYLILAIFAGLVCAPLNALGKMPAHEAVTLNQAVKVDAAVVRLGDLFTGAGDQADVAVAYAPEPGKRSSFDARWLYRVAKAYRLKWRPINDRVRAIVSRESQVISRAEIETAIHEALIGKGADDDMEVELANRFVQMHVPGSAIAAVGIDDVQYDPRSRRFSVVVSAPADAADAKRLRLSGKLHKTIDVPVLNRRVLGGEMIKKTDVKWVRIRARRLQPNTITSEADLIGKTPRRGLRGGYPILSTSVRRPILVPKGSLVTMILQAPKMLLTAQGKALDNGSDGDVIRISNTQSSNVIEAEVIGHGKVAVRASTLVAMN